MSVISWYLIIWKGWRSWYMRRHAERAMDAFWEGEDLAEAVAHMQLAAPDSPFSETAAEGANAAAHHARHAGGKIAASLSLSEFVTRAIRRGITRTTARLESGLSVLASIGATAPFVGLFGTVWGIYHALIGIGFTGEATIDKVAGPVGEALIMTAFGIAVAVPAVLGYNFLSRANRVILAELDAFAHDLHAYLTTGAKLTMTHEKDAGVASLRPRNR
jgi:biopolymer transport protein ExbB